MSEQALQEEQKHFAFCQSIIRDNITRYEKEYESRHAQVQQLYKAVNSGDTELYNQLMTSISLEEQAESSLLKNLAAMEKPYFGRIDYQELANQTLETVYIGKNGIFRSKTEVLIADWRAPISSVYYENELGFGEYGLPDEKRIEIDLKRKRTYDISYGQLNGYYDSDVASNDELLVKYLSRNKDAVLGEIIATIQKEQNSIIRESPFANLIVQGVAGSGKTTVAMHRISYLLYNYKERFESNEFCIVGSNDLLLDYITSGLPELDVPNIKHMRMDQLFNRLCGKNQTKQPKTMIPDATACRRCTITFIQSLELYLMNLRETIVDCAPLEDKDIGRILSQTGSQTLLREHPTYSICRLLTTLDERVKTRIRFLMSDREKEELQAKLHEYVGWYKKKKPKNTIHDLYLEFITQWAGQQKSSLVPSEITDSYPGSSFSLHLEQVRHKQYDLYDLAALALIYYRVYQPKPNEEFGLLFLDEAQDFGLSIYYVLKTILPDTYFTIMGDVSQNINYETGINDWYDLTRLFLTNPKDKFLLLQKSYRNTIEISEYAGKILEKASSGRYKITPVIRHGQPVTEETFWSEPELAQRSLAVLESSRTKGYTTAAIICPDEKDVERIRLLFDKQAPVLEEKQHYSTGLMILPFHMVKGLEFDTVILWNPDMKNGLNHPAQAKLLYVAATRALHELYVFTC